MTHNTCKIYKCSRTHWLDEERGCETHRVRWHLDVSGKSGKRIEPTECPVALAKEAKTRAHHRGFSDYVMIYAPSEIFSGALNAAGEAHKAAERNDK